METRIVVPAPQVWELLTASLVVVRAPAPPALPSEQSQLVCLPAKLLDVWML